MFKDKKILVAGAGGFISGYLIKRLMDMGAKIVAVDVKPKEYWFQIFDDNDNHQLDLKELNNCYKVAEGVDYVFNMACNMGGMGFIENNKAECMLSVLINTHLLMACKKFGVKKYFFSSSACAYNKDKQEEVFIDGLKESDAYPANPEDGYGWEKLFSERMCRHFSEDFGVKVCIARYHNIYGPQGTFDGGREKAPAALSRKVAQCIIDNKKDLEVWGDGKQTRTFLFVDDCVEGTLKLFQSDHEEPINIGSDEQVSINQMIDMIEEIAGIKKLERIYLLDKPKGVRGRSSNNEQIKKVLNWNYSISLKEGLTKTYSWIYDQLTNNKSNSGKFTRF